MATEAATSGRDSWRTPVALFALGLTVRLLFISLHPIVYGGDSVMRMMNADRILIAYQLPFLQLLIFAANLLSPDPGLLRYLMALIGSLAGVAFYWLSSVLWGRDAARLCALFFILNPFILVHSLVPYQEVLVLLLLCGGLALLFENNSRGRLALASLCLGLACLTRYEAWIVTAAAAGFHWFNKRGKRSPLPAWKSGLETFLLFGWAPTLWTFLHQGLSPSGTFVLEGIRAWQRVYRIPYVLLMSAYHAGVPLLPLAGWGTLEFFRTSLWRDRRVQMLMVATGGFLVALPMSAHGVPPDPVSMVTDRESHWLLLPLFWAAGLGAHRFKKLLMPTSAWGPSGRTKTAVVRGAIYHSALGACLLWGLAEANRRIASLTSAASLQLDYAVAQHLDRHLPGDSNVLILAEPVPAAAVQEYLDRARRKAGSRGEEAARRLISLVDTGPFDYSRTVVNSRLGKSRFFHMAQLEALPNKPGIEALRSLKIRVVVIFANYTPSTDRELRLLAFVRQHGRKQTDLTRAGQSASIFELSN